MKPIHTLALLMVTTLGTSLPTQACSYEGQLNNPFTESFPGALDVAIATQDALESEQLQRIDPLSGQPGLRRASWLLQLMVKQLNEPLKANTYIYLIDSQLWSKVVEDNRVNIHANPAGINESSILLLSEAALNAIVSKNMDLKQAQALGIIQFSS